MNPRLRTLLRHLRRLAHEHARSRVTPACHCPTWRELPDALAAASLAAGHVGGGRPVTAVLGALSAVADLLARANTDDPTN